jgi:hypothetical protein
MDLVSLVSNHDKWIDHNVLRNQFFLSEMMVFGITNCTHTHSMKILVLVSIVMLFFQATRITILENQSTTTKTKSFSFLVEGRNNM